MTRVSPYLAPVLLALLLSCDIQAADYENGLAPPGAPANELTNLGCPVLARFWLGRGLSAVGP